MRTLFSSAVFSEMTEFNCCTELFSEATELFRPASFLRTCCSSSFSWAVFAARPAFSFLDNVQETEFFDPPDLCVLPTDPVQVAGAQLQAVLLEAQLLLQPGQLLLQAQLLGAELGLQPRLQQLLKHGIRIPIF